MCTSKALYKKIIKNKNSELHKQNIKNINNVPETYICFISIMFVFWTSWSTKWKQKVFLLLSTRRHCKYINSFLFKELRVLQRTHLIWVLQWTHWLVLEKNKRIWCTWLVIENSKLQSTKLTTRTWCKIYKSMKYIVFTKLVIHLVVWLVVNAISMK